MTLGVVTVEQRFGPGLAANDRPELPGEVEGVAHAVVHALTPDGDMDVPGVARQEHALLPESPRQPVLRAETGDPPRVGEPQAGFAGHLARDGLDFLQRDRPGAVGVLLGLETQHAVVTRRVERQAHQRAILLDESVAGSVGAGPVNLCVGHHEFLPGITLAVERDAHRLACLAARSRAVHQPRGMGRRDAVALGVVTEGDVDAVAVLRKRRGLDLPFDADAEPLQMRDEELLGHLLADRQHVGIGAVRAAGPNVADGLAEGVQADEFNRMARFEPTIDDAHGGEDFLRADVHGQRLRVN